jgi:succinate dehydrogenase / fumarate reductase iron-sulfur subunit
VAPMSQIMRLRRRAGADYEIDDRNNGHRHEESFVTLVRDYGLLHEAELLPRSFGGNSWFGKFHPAAGQVLLKSLPAIVPAVLKGKVNIKTALLGHKIAKPDLDAVKRLFKKIEDRPDRVELNLYVSGYEDDPAPEAVGAGVGGGSVTSSGEGPESASSESETS